MPVQTIKIRFKYLFESLVKRNQVTNTSGPGIPKVTVNKVLHASTAPTAIPLTKILIKLPKLFPRSIADSFNDYRYFHTNESKIQEDLLATLPFFMNSHESDKTAELIKTPIDDEGNYINEFCIKPKNPGTGKLKHLIFVHGYGAGLGFYLKNLENLPLLNNNWCIHAIDLPGFGYSTRPKFPFKYPDSSNSAVNEWFHSRINKWFEKRGLLERPHDNIVMAHSLGAYLMALYGEKYPNHFNKLIMCSPAGVCCSQNVVKSNVNKNLKETNGLSPPWWYVKLWDKNYSPFTIVRSASFLGSKLTSGWSYRRFKSLLASSSSNDITRKQFEMLHRYSYGIFNRPGSGEYLLAFTLSCGGDPRNSLEDTIFKDINPINAKSSCKWVWLYGENDWMNKSGGKRVSAKLNDVFGEGKSKFLIVPNAGHHLYFDNYKFFNNLMIDEMQNL